MSTASLSTCTRPHCHGEREALGTPLPDFLSPCQVNGHDWNFAPQVPRCRRCAVLAWESPNGAWRRSGPWNSTATKETQ